MGVEFINIKDLGPSELALEAYCTEHNLELKMEWREGQYWLHSNLAKELPIGIEVDKELKRHEAYFKQNSVYKEILGKALGLKPNYRPKIIDLSAGLLGDTLLFLSFGCQVIAIERHPMVALLIESALKNATHPLIQNLTFLHTGAASYLTSFDQSDVLYFDPMFEDSNDRAAPRKEMRIFRDFVGQDKDAEEIFLEALRKNVKRLVVKRPKHSNPLSIKASLEFVGKATRYDVYLGQNLLKY